ncbi:MAG: SpoIVB peptidase [Ruminococcaceae bacterium]|nr:SpoIVB peptidase [Oscillospiraceae bacterium]
MRRIIRALCTAVGTSVAALLTAALVMGAALPDRFIVVQGEEFTLGSRQYLCADVIESADGKNEASVKLLGCVAVKKVEIAVAEEESLIVSGAPIGIKMFTQGAVIVGMTDINGEVRMRSPAEEAGLKIGDIIIEADGKTVDGNEVFSKAIEQSGGEAVALKYDRNGSIFETEIVPEKPKGGNGFRAGVWVRDSAAGIGTLTFYDPDSGRFAGLGHPVCDMDTGQQLPLRSGEIVEVTVSGVVHGQSGNPGELTGTFTGMTALGELSANCDTGIYGYMSDIPEGKMVKTAVKQEIKVGPAVILSTVIGTEPKEYDIYIEKIDLSGKSKTKNMVIRIDDPDLLRETGGIVQGMSGSPILQDGKLVGAVTHVLVNEPTRGYGIFIENMLEAAG